MTSQVLPRIRKQKVSVSLPGTVHPRTKKPVTGPSTLNLGTSRDVLYLSEGNPVNPKTGVRESGGDFYTTHEGPFNEPGVAANVVNHNGEQMYSGPIYGIDVSSSAPIATHHVKLAPSSMEIEDSDGTVAISRCAPSNPTTSVATGVSESFREGVPSLFGIQSWKKRTEALRAAGSEYLNYQFGWAPLQSEINDVVNVSRNHRNLLYQYKRDEGRNVHRRFDFSPEISSWDEELEPSSQLTGVVNGTSWLWFTSNREASRVIRVKTTRRKWFEGCFTYGGPSGIDSFRNAERFGREADALYGTHLTPSVLWELTPWSWAVDWFSNAGDLIKNLTAFSNAGLVMRYGYMMEEFTSIRYTSFGNFPFGVETKPFSYSPVSEGSNVTGVITRTRARKRANPFGFGIGWEGLSPTQLAITAAIGITRFP